MNLSTKRLEYGNRLAILAIVDADTDSVVAIMAEGSEGLANVMAASGELKTACVAAEEKLVAFRKFCHSCDYSWEPEDQEAIDLCRSAIAKATQANEPEAVTP